MMMKLFAMALIIFGFAQAHAADSCEIQPSTVFCDMGGVTYDYGCSVQCEKGQQAACSPASGISDDSNPIGMQNCQLFPSYCSCEN